MDLRTRVPRSPRETLGGYVHLARMIDKCRATLAGTPGEYIYPCPMDKRLLEFAGIPAEQFTEAVRAGGNDREVLDRFTKLARPRSPAEIDAWNQSLLAHAPDTPEKWDYFTKTREAIDPSRTDVTTWVDLLDLEEQRPVPARTASR